MTDMSDDLPDGPVNDPIADLIRSDYELAQQQAWVPPAEVVWLRAELRAREEAARKATRPILVAQSVAIAAFAGLLVSVVSRFSLSELPQIPLPLVEIVIGSWLLLAPIALYFVLSRD
jgi:hypothetical protein